MVLIKPRLLEGDVEISLDRNVTNYMSVIFSGSAINHYSDNLFIIKKKKKKNSKTLETLYLLAKKRTMLASYFGENRKESKSVNSPFTLFHFSSNS